MDQLFITTASDGLSEQQLKDAPLSGSLFICEPGVKGLLDAEYNG
jgi:sugar lactone lactonase YvrE